MLTNILEIKELFELEWADKHPILFALIIVVAIVVLMSNKNRPTKPKIEASGSINDIKIY